jgi:Fe-S-cluster containining protein
MVRYILKLEGKWDGDKAKLVTNKSLYKLEGVCPFLEGEEGSTSCRIYQFRPTVCRVFPASNDCGTTKDNSKTEINDV